MQIAFGGEPGEAIDASPDQNPYADALLAVETVIAEHQAEFRPAVDSQFLRFEETSPTGEDAEIAYSQALLLLRKLQRQLEAECTKDPAQRETPSELIEAARHHTNFALYMQVPPRLQEAWDNGVNAALARLTQLIAHGGTAPDEFGVQSVISERILGVSIGARGPILTVAPLEKKYAATRAAERSTRKLLGLTSTQGIVTGTREGTRRELLRWLEETTAAYGPQ